MKQTVHFEDFYNNVYNSIEDIEDNTVVFQIPESTGFIVQNF